MNRKTYLFRVWVLGIYVIAIAGSTAHASREKSLPHDYSVRPGASLLLRVPYETLLSGELSHIYLGIKNGSDEPLLLLEPFGTNAEYQLLCEARANPSGRNLTDPEFIPSWDLIVNKRELGNMPYIITYIGKGESRLFAAQREIVPNYGWVPVDSREIRWSLLTGPNEWVLSDWVRIKRASTQRLEDAELVGTLEVHFGGKYPLRKATIDGESYLFVMGTRIARIPPGAALRFEWDLANWILTVHFDGVAVPPLVYSVKMKETRSWTPETAPHMVVLEQLKRDLQKTMSVSSVQEAAPPRDQMKGPQPNQPSNEEKPHKRDTSLWVWVGALLGALLAGWVVMRCFRGK